MSTDKMMPFEIRILGFSWGLAELFGVLFTTGNPFASAFAFYAMLPAIALLVCSVVPDMMRNALSAQVFLICLLLAGVVRRVHTIAQELTDTPPYFYAAGLQAVTLAILLVMSVYLGRIAFRRLKHQGVSASR